MVQSLHGSTCRVYSWNTYLARLFIMNTFPDIPDRFHVRLYFRVHVVDLLSVNTMCDFERGGAKKLIIAEITAKWTALTCVRYRNVPIWFCWLFFIEYNVFKYPSYPAWSVLNIFFCQHTHTDTMALLYPCCTCTRGVKAILSGSLIHHWPKFSISPGLPFS